jgi:hypothetical protein
MNRHLRIVAAAAAIALAVAPTGARACVVTTAPANAGPAIWPMLPIVCSVLAPMFVSAMDGGRELKEKEIWATTLTCFTGPIGYAIAVKKGWIGPCDKRHK